MSEWINVSDKLPEFRLPVLTIGLDGDGKRTTPVVATLYAEGFITAYKFCGDRYVSFAVETKPTHWMYLPEDPPN